VVNAFVDNGRGGNPAGVVLNAERFSQAQKQAIAAKVGLSETAFVSPSRTADFKLEFFTPTRQIPHCGHATIATFSSLVQLGLLDGARSSTDWLRPITTLVINRDTRPENHRRRTQFTQRVVSFAQRYGRSVRRAE
jgi:PhzF family phenazine biosynthesis protein